MKRNELELLMTVVAIKPEITNPRIQGALIWYPDMDKFEGRNLTITRFSNPNELGIVIVGVKETEFKFDAEWLRLISKPNLQVEDAEWLCEWAEKNKQNNISNDTDDGLSQGITKNYHSILTDGNIHIDQEVVSHQPKKDYKSPLKWHPLKMLNGEILTIKKMRRFKECYVINVKENECLYDAEWLSAHSKNNVRKKIQVQVKDRIKLKEPTMFYDLPNHRPKWFPEMSQLVKNNVVFTVCSLTFCYDKHGHFIRVAVLENPNEFDSDWVEILPVPPKNGFTLVKSKVASRHPAYEMMHSHHGYYDSCGGWD